jgi:hypothetical protein
MYLLLMALLLCLLLSVCLQARLVMVAADALASGSGFQGSRVLSSRGSRRWLSLTASSCNDMLLTELLQWHHSSVDCRWAW